MIYATTQTFSIQVNTSPEIEPQTAIAQTTQTTENPILAIADNFANRYPNSFEWWVWIFLIVQLIKAVADLRNGGDD
ncbi:MAG: hypothetical protein ACFCA4_15945 [Cyanophyceae cyanobacterium]